MSAPDDTALARARRLLAGAPRILVLTGAGVSAESGVPTFRGVGGLWKQFRAEELATPGAFARDPRLVWEWYGWRRALVSRCAPNEAHRALARLALTRRGVHLATQNVDELHHRAAREVGGALGVPSEAAEPLALHGSLFQVRCTRCAYRAAHHDPIDASTTSTLPHCPECGALLRPGVVWFGEELDARVLEAAAAYAAGASCCLVVGTSALVHPAAGLAEVTRRAGGAVVEVNLEPTPLTAVADVSLHGPAAALVPALLARNDAGI